MLGSLRNVPIQIWVGTTDQLVPYQGPLQQSRQIDALDYRYEFWSFSPADHFTLATYDEYGPAASFLGDARVDRNPAHVTFVRNPKMDFADAGTKADHAYWVSGVEVAKDSGDTAFGTVDVRSEGFGVGDPRRLRHRQRRGRADRRQPDAAAGARLRAPAQDLGRRARRPPSATGS